MKAACIVLTVLIFIAIMAVCVMVKFATDITVEERKREHMPGGAVGGGGGVYHYTKSMGVITLNDNSSLPIAERFPYVAAITRNSSALWSFACFASVVLIKWVITSAHCRFVTIIGYSYQWFVVETQTYFLPKKFELNYSSCIGPAKWMPFDKVFLFSVRLIFVSCPSLCLNTFGVQKLGKILKSVALQHSTITHI